MNISEWITKAAINDIFSSKPLFFTAPLDPSPLEVSRVVRAATVFVESWPIEWAALHYGRVTRR